MAQQTSNRAKSKTAPQKKKNTNSRFKLKRQVFTEEEKKRLAEISGKSNYVDISKDDSVKSLDTDDQAGDAIDPLGDTHVPSEPPHEELDAKQEFIRAVIYTEDPELVEQIEDQAKALWLQYEEAGLSEEQSKALTHMFCIAHERSLRADELPTELPKVGQIPLYKDRSPDIETGIKEGALEFYRRNWQPYHEARLLLMSDLRLHDEGLDAALRGLSKPEKQTHKKALPVAKADYNQQRESLISPILPFRNLDRRKS